MARKRGLIFAIIFVLILGAANIYLFVNKQGVSYNAISGQFIKEIPKLPSDLNISMIAFIVQWIILILIVLFAYSKFLKTKKQEKINISYNEIKLRKNTKAKTDLDVLYEILQEKKKLKINSIAKTFRIEKEKAIDWAKILENQELAQIEYPAFSEPELRLKEEMKENEEEKEGEKTKEEKSKQEEKQKGKPRKASKAKARKEKRKRRKKK